MDARATSNEDRAGRCAICDVSVPAEGWDLHVETPAHLERLRSLPELGMGVLGQACCPTCRSIQIMPLDSLQLVVCRECDQVMRPYSGVSLAEQFLSWLGGSAGRPLTRVRR